MRLLARRHWQIVDSCDSQADRLAQSGHSIHDAQCVAVARRWHLRSPNGVKSAPLDKSGLPAVSGHAMILALQPRIARMDRTERFKKIRQSLERHRVVSFEAVRAMLEVSRATLNRDLAYLRDRLNTPIMFDREAGGYRIDRAQAAMGGQYELPGLWFTAAVIWSPKNGRHEAW